jgi:hypothetical protein
VIGSVRRVCALSLFRPNLHVVVFSFGLIGVAAACGDSATPSDGGPPGECDPSSDGPVAMDGGAAPTADGAGRCASDELCLAVDPAGERGRCFPRCSSDSECARGRMCGSDGACVPRSGPPSDGGMPDGDAPADAGEDPCQNVDCSGMTPACHPATGECVQCGADNDGQCGLATGPVCDVARGQCTSVTPGLCSPCQREADCPSEMACRSLQDPLEQVCLPSCGGDAGSCPQGTECDGSGVCRPRAGSCTAFRSASNERSCDSASDCVPRGATEESSHCVGATADGGTSVCRLRCGSTADCPAECGGVSCTCSDMRCTPAG